ncbi:MAG TPA: hypothetical protein PK440_21555, partial [Candidatus Accumulibacter phosphatis]|nr:hypothetical protein [Candidatus Accumulibacter phosphatis]HRQ97540.1 hypothetical protein [Candidatus Accumulibacter phosphatis]
MTDTLFKEVHYSLGNLIGDIGRGRIELHAYKRPFFLVQHQALCTRNDLANWTVICPSVARRITVASSVNLPRPTWRIPG